MNTEQITQYIRKLIDFSIPRSLIAKFYARIRPSSPQLNKYQGTQQKQNQTGLQLAEFGYLASGRRSIQNNGIQWQGLFYTAPELGYLAKHSSHVDKINSAANLSDWFQKQVAYSLHYKPTDISTVALCEGENFLCYIKAIELRQDNGSYLNLSLSEWQTIRAKIPPDLRSRTNIKAFIRAEIEAFVATNKKTASSTKP